MRVRIRRRWLLFYALSPRISVRSPFSISSCSLSTHLSRRLVYNEPVTMHAHRSLHWSRETASFAGLLNRRSPSRYFLTPFSLPGTFMERGYVVPLLISVHSSRFGIPHRYQVRCVVLMYFDRTML
ncbi:hypothetical protein BDN72DRAFT_592140 [Pluteus cervinus]|uniref:Uncharacterized protein n=1 Tax=Pluteus cervinus TaxID=181527 RepID=A0ACD3AVS9_9AGAR|nr:hypothetical protein BDN72DRAFT_592140 [Pluteus cervinus]